MGNDAVIEIGGTDAQPIYLSGEPVRKVVICHTVQLQCEPASYVINSNRPVKTTCKFDVGRK